MKKLFNIIIAIGTVLVLGAAGSADIAAGNLLQPVLLMFLGSSLVCLGVYCKERYRRYMRRCNAIRKRNPKLCANNSKELVKANY